MGSRNTLSYYDLQASLYQKAYAAAHSYPSVNSTKLRSYAANFNKMLPDLYWPLDEAALFQECRSSDFILYGDFHTLKQSQRGLLRILRNLPKNHSFVLALEMFSIKDQKHLDAYIKGQITVDQLHELTKYRSTWGFPWHYYAPLIDFARANQIPIYGINTPKTKTKITLTSRDNAIARNLLSIKAVHSDATIITMIGEYHLADEHLPRQIRQLAHENQAPVTVKSIINNIDKYYFSLLAQNPQPIQSEYLRLRNDLFCLINTPAWMKWQSLANWEELISVEPTTRDQLLDTDDELSHESSLDFEHQLYEIAQHLCNYLGISRGSSELQDIYFYQSFAPDLLRTLRRSKISTSEIATLTERLDLDGYVFLADQKSVIIKNFELNILNRLAGEHLFSLPKREYFKSANSTQAFYLRVLQKAAGYFSEKILNPRKKNLDMKAYVSCLSAPKKPRAGNENEKFRRVAQLLKEHHNITQQQGHSLRQDAQPLRKYVRYDQQHAHVLSKAVAEVIGSQLAERVLTNRTPLSAFKFIFDGSIHHNNCIDAFIKLNLIVAGTDQAPTETAAG